MIRVVIKGNIDNITIKGHANYDEYGKDIVCASVSTMYITTINAILRIDCDAIEYDDEHIKVLKQNETVNKLLENLVDLLQELEKQYPKYIEIRRC